MASRDGDGAARLGRSDGGHVEGGAVLVGLGLSYSSSSAARGRLVGGGREQSLDAVGGPANKRANVPTRPVATRARTFYERVLQYYTLFPCLLHPQVTDMTIL